MSKSTHNWAERFQATWSRRPSIIVIAILVVTVSSVATLAQAGLWLAGEYSTNFRWRQQEERIINSLSASIHIDKFRELLGSHLFLRKNDSYSEYTFKRPGYWVQAVTDSTGSVVFYSVTSCDSSFRPLIRNHPSGTAIRLRETTFQQSGNGELDYYVSGATANSYILEADYLANPGNYQTAVYGYNDACGVDWPDSIWRELTAYLGKNPSPDPDDPVIQRFRKTEAFNTIGFTAPGISPTDLPDGFRRGVDRQQVRVYRGTDRERR